MVILILSFHHEISTVSSFQGFCTMCEANLPTMFQNCLGSHLQSSNVHLLCWANVHLTSEDGAQREFQNVVGKFASHIMQKPRNQETMATLFQKLLQK
jgi:hypothetical protein